jgi:hypothetical protein
MINNFLLFYSFINLFKPFVKNHIHYNSKYSIFDESFIFKNISNIHMDYINKLNMTEINHNKKYSFLELNNPKCYSKNIHYNNNLFRKVRLSYFYSQKQEMFNSVWYPHYNYDAPIFSLDIVKFNNKTISCLINLYEIKKYKYSQLFNNIKDKYMNKYSSNEKKEMAIKKLNPYFFILGNSSLHINLYNVINLKEVTEPLLEYLDTYITIIHDEEDTDIVELKQKLYNYFRMNIEKQFIIKNYYNKTILNEINKYNL